MELWDNNKKSKFHFRVSEESRKRVGLKKYSKKIIIKAENFSNLAKDINLQI